VVKYLLRPAKRPGLDVPQPAARPSRFCNSDGARADRMLATGRTPGRQFTAMPTRSNLQQELPIELAFRTASQRLASA